MTAKSMRKRRMPIYYIPGYNSNHELIMYGPEDSQSAEFVNSVNAISSALSSAGLIRSKNMYVHALDEKIDSLKETIGSEEEKSRRKLLRNSLEKLEDMRKKQGKTLEQMVRAERRYNNITPVFSARSFRKLDEAEQASIRTAIRNVFPMEIQHIKTMNSFMEAQLRSTLTETYNPEDPVPKKYYALMLAASLSFPAIKLIRNAIMLPQLPYIPQNMIQYALNNYNLSLLTGIGDLCLCFGALGFLLYRFSKDNTKRMGSSIYKKMKILGMFERRQLGLGMLEEVVGNDSFGIEFIVDRRLAEIYKKIESSDNRMDAMRKAWMLSSALNMPLAVTASYFSKFERTSQRLDETPRYGPTPGGNKDAGQ